MAGAGLARKFRVVIRPGWAEPTNLFTVTALLVGERKSAVFADALKPVQQFEREEMERMAPIIAEAESERRMMEATLKGLENKAAKTNKAEEAAQLRREAKNLAKELARYKVPAVPQMFVDDVTPEALSQKLAQQGGRILQASPEGTPIEIAKGRYSEIANFDVYLKGHAGDPLRVGRVSRDGEIIDQPALSLALAVQPDVIRGLGENPSMRARGFLARFLYSLPTSKVGKRQIAPGPVPSSVAEVFQANMVALWRTEASVDEKGNLVPHFVHFSEKADKYLQIFEEWLEPQLAEGAELSDLAGWANKLAGAIARISSILHLAEIVEQQSSWNTRVAGEMVERVIDLAVKYLIPHAQAAFGMMASSPHLDDAKRVLVYLKRDLIELIERLKGAPIVVTKSKIHRGVFGGSRSVEEVDKVIDVLQKHQYLRPYSEVKEAKYEGRGRRSGAAFEVNPDLWTDTPLSIFQSIQTNPGQEEGEA
jgi:hypothetical protein